MARKATILSPDESNIDMTPMLDVVFIMLIFFIVTSSFTKEAGTVVVKPVAETAKRKELTSLLIAVTARNEIWMERRIIDKASVKPVIQKLYSENPKGAVVIQADRDSDASTVLYVMEAAREVGVKDIAIAALEQ
jgi:biopolymer transport protein ExbD